MIKLGLAFQALNITSMQNTTGNKNSNFKAKGLHLISLCDTGQITAIILMPLSLSIKRT